MTDKVALAQELSVFDHICFGTEAMSSEEWSIALDANTREVREYRDGKVVGIAVIKWAAGIGYLYSNAVLPDYRNQGIGTRLIRMRLDFVKNFCLKVQAHTRINNEASQAILRKCGFVPIHYVPDFYGDCEDAVLWEKVLL